MFARGGDNALWQAPSSGGEWVWQRIGGGITSSPSAVVNLGNVQVFARGLDGALWQNTGSGSTGTWRNLGGGLG